MLVELAIGDAYGAGFEYAPPEFVTERNTLSEYVQHPRHTALGPGAYTDDTQMSIAIGELLLSDDTWAPELVADRFVRCYRRDARVGYSRRTEALLRASDSGADLLAAVGPGYDRSGAAMRAGPLGVLATVDEVVWHAEIQARITHDSPAAVEAAQAAALAVHYCYHRLGPTSAVSTWVDRRLRARGGREDWSAPWRGAVDARAVASVRAALTALSRARGLSELLHACIAYTGDVDTVAAIALAAGSCASDLDRDLPRQLYDGLENGRYGRDYLAQLDARLVARYPSATPT